MPYKTSMTTIHVDNIATCLKIFATILSPAFYLFYICCIMYNG